MVTFANVMSAKVWIKGGVLELLVIIMNRTDECWLLGGGRGGGERSLNADTLSLMGECVSIHRDSECGWETMTEEASGDNFWTSESKAPMELSSRQQAMLICSSCGNLS